MGGAPGARDEPRLEGDAHEGPGHRRRRFPRPGAVPRAASNAATRSSASTAAAIPRSTHSACARCRATSPMRDAVRRAPRSGCDAVLPQRGQGRRLGQLRRATTAPTCVGTDNVHRRLPRARHRRASSTPRRRASPTARRIRSKAAPPTPCPTATASRRRTPTTKTIAEQAVLAANDATLATVALRPRLIWGPGDNQLLPRLVERARAGRLRFVGDGDNRIDTTYIDNAAQAHFDALRPPRAGRRLRRPRVLHQQRRAQAAARDRQRACCARPARPRWTSTLPFRAAYAIGAVLRSGCGTCCRLRGRAADDALPRRAAVHHALVRHRRRRRAISATCPRSRSPTAWRCDRGRAALGTRRQSA